MEQNKEFVQNSKHVKFVVSQSNPKVFFGAKVQQDEDMKSLF